MRRVSRRKSFIENITGSISSREYATSMEFKNGDRMEYVTYEKHFEPWIYHDGTYKEPSVESLELFPLESYGSKEGVFLKSDPSGQSWKERYFVVRGGMLLYYKAVLSAFAQGAVPLKGCRIELPVDRSRSFCSSGRKDISSFELRIAHPRRRAFMFAFPTSNLRDEWKEFLEGYIINSFRPRQYQEAEMVEAVSEGIHVIKKRGKVGSNSHREFFNERGYERYLYIDWYSSDPLQWSLRYSHKKINVTLNTADDHTSHAIALDTTSTKAIKLRFIEDVVVERYPSTSMKIYYRDPSRATAHYEVDVLLITPLDASVARLLVSAVKAALTLQDLALPAAHSRSDISNIRAMLESGEEPLVYNREYFLVQRCAQEGEGLFVGHGDSTVSTLTELQFDGDDDEGDAADSSDDEECISKVKSDGARHKLPFTNQLKLIRRKQTEKPVVVAARPKHQALFEDFSEGVNLSPTHKSACVVKRSFPASESVFSL